MSLRDQRQWLRQRAARLAFGSLTLLGHGNAALADEHSEKAHKKAHDAELTQPYQAPARADRAGDQHVAVARPGPTPAEVKRQAELKELRDKAKELKHIRDEGDEAAERAFKRRPPRDR